MSPTDPTTTSLSPSHAEETRRRETTHLHFDLSRREADREFTLHACLDEHRLLPHTSETRAAARRAVEVLSRVPDERLTHYAPALDLPADMPLLLWVTSPSRIDHTDRVPEPESSEAALGTLELACVHVPRHARQTAVRAMRDLPEHPCHGPVDEPDLPDGPRQHPELRRLGIAPDEAADAGDEWIVDVHDWKTAMDAAVCLVTLHQELLNLDAETAARVMTHIEYANGITDLAVSIEEQAEEHRARPTLENNWINPSHWLDPATLEPMADEPRWSWSKATEEWVVGPMLEALRSTKNSPDLESTPERAGCWTIQPGTTTRGVDASGTDELAVLRRAAKLESSNDTAAKETAAGWCLDNLTAGHGLHIGDLTQDADRITVPMRNSWLRYLSVYVEFLDVDDEPFDPPGWKPLGDRSWDGATEKYVDLLPAVSTILGIPYGSKPVDITFPMPAAATAVRIKAGGLGQMKGIGGVGGWEPTVCSAGVAMTSVFNLGIPLLAMIAGASVSGPSLSALAKVASKEVIGALRLLLMAKPMDDSFSSGSDGAWKTIANSLVRAAITASTAVAVYVATKIGTGAAKKAVPIVGWIATAVSMVVDAALLAQTSIEVSQSPATFLLKGERKMALRVPLTPDARHPGRWPTTATHYRVAAIYRTDDLADGQAGTVFPALTPGGDQDLPLSPTRTGERLETTLEGVPWGGEVQVVAGFYSETGWLAGHWQSERLDAAPNETIDGVPTLTLPTAAITEQLVPLGPGSAYSPRLTLSYQEGARTWRSDRFEIDQHVHGIARALDLEQTSEDLRAAFRDAGYPLSGPVRVTVVDRSSIDTSPRGGDRWLLVDTASSFHVAFLAASGERAARLRVAPADAGTRSDLDPSNIGENLAQIVDITYSPAAQAVGTAWQGSGQGIPIGGGDRPDSRQMYTFQSLPDAGAPEAALKFVSHGRAAKTLLLYDRYDTARATAFVIDPSPQGEHHLRRLDLSQPGPFDPPVDKSWGRFTQQIDAASLHPNGYVIGVNTRNSKVEVLPILPTPMNDADAPRAILYSGRGTRPGLIHRPVALTTTPEGVVLILEDTSATVHGGARVQAFDYQLDPVFCFRDAAGNETPLLRLRDEPEPSTPLDVAAEATGFLYVLKFVGAGHRVEDYRLDLYDPQGTFVSQTVGVNAARLAVTLWREMWTAGFLPLAGSPRTEPTVQQWIASTPSTPSGPTGPSAGPEPS